MFRKTLVFGGILLGVIYAATHLSILSLILKIE